jgi:hypothetical protein
MVSARKSANTLTLVGGRRVEKAKFLRCSKFQRVEPRKF